VKFRWLRSHAGRILTVAGDSGVEALAYPAQVADQERHRIVPVLRIGPEDGGWVKRGYRGPPESRLEELAVVLHHAGLGADHGLHRGRAEADQHLGVDHIELGLEFPLGVHLKCLTTLVT
jgi:hypothetical protein